MHMTFCNAHRLLMACVFQFVDVFCLNLIFRFMFHIEFELLLFVTVSTLKITTNVSFTQTSTLTTENNSCCFSSTSNTGKPTDSIETATLYRNGGITSNTDFASNVSTTSSTLSISSSHIGDNTEDQNDYDDAHSRHKSKNVQTKTRTY